MNIGKLPPAMLEELIINKLSSRRSEVLVHSATGQDSCFLSTNNQPIVLSTDPITGEVERIGWFAIHVACNDIAANGAEPIGVLLTLLLPPGYEPQKIAKIMDDANAAATELNIDILGGHTELTDAVTRPIVSTTAIGKAVSEPFIISSSVKPKLDIVLTKGAGIEGTAILADIKFKFLESTIGTEVLEKAKKLTNQLSVVPESKVAIKIGVQAMHDVTEGGVLGALYEVVQAGHCGFVVYYDSIPILPETKAICDVLGVDVLRLISSGSMLIFTEKGQRMVEALAEANILAAIIGKTTAEESYLLQHNNTLTAVAPPESDELWRIVK